MKKLGLMMMKTLFEFSHSMSVKSFTKIESTLVKLLTLRSTHLNPYF